MDIISESYLIDSKIIWISWDHNISPKSLQLVVAKAQQGRWQPRSLLRHTNRVIHLQKLIFQDNCSENDLGRPQKLYMVPLKPIGSCTSIIINHHQSSSLTARTGLEAPGQLPLLQRNPSPSFPAPPCRRPQDPQVPQVTRPPRPPRPRPAARAGGSWLRGRGGLSPRRCCDTSPRLAGWNSHAERPDGSRASRRPQSRASGSHPTRCKARYHATPSLSPGLGMPSTWICRSAKYGPTTWKLTSKVLRPTVHCSHRSAQWSQVVFPRHHQNSTFWPFEATAEIHPSWCPPWTACASTKLPAGSSPLEPLPPSRPELAVPTSPPW